MPIPTNELDEELDTLDEDGRRRPAWFRRALAALLRSMAGRLRSGDRSSRSSQFR